MLTPKQEAFCMAYAKCGNATQAYNEASAPKSDNIAAAASARLLRNVKIQSRLQEIRQKIEDDKIMGPKEMQQILTGIARQTARDPDGKAPKYNDALKAAELLAKMQGAFAPDKVELTQMPVVLHDDVGDTS